MEMISHTYTPERRQIKKRKGIITRATNAVKRLVIALAILLLIVCGSLAYSITDSTLATRPARIMASGVSYAAKTLVYDLPAWFLMIAVALIGYLTYKHVLIMSVFWGMLLGGLIAIIGGNR